MDNLEPGRDLTHQKEHAEPRSQSSQTEESTLLMAKQVTASDCKHCAASQKDRGGCPEHAGDLDVSPKLLACRAVQEDGDDGAESHGHGGKDNDDGQCGKGVELSLTRGGLDSSLHFTYYDASWGLSGCGRAACLRKVGHFEKSFVLSDLSRRHSLRRPFLRRCAASRRHISGPETA